MQKYNSFQRKEEIQKNNRTIAPDISTPTKSFAHGHSSSSDLCFVALTKSLDKSSISTNALYGWSIG